MAQLAKVGVVVLWWRRVGRTSRQACLPMDGERESESVDDVGHTIDGLTVFFHCLPLGMIERADTWEQVARYWSGMGPCHHKRV